MSKLSELGAKGCAPWLDFVDRKFLEAKAWKSSSPRTG